MEYKFVGEERGLTDRDVMLRNIETGQLEVCFDDSWKFEFMEIGKHYECKIALFGSETNENIGDWREYEVLDENIEIGKSKYFKLRFIDDIYYVNSKNAQYFVNDNKLSWESVRKDLIEVDGVAARV